MKIANHIIENGARSDYLGISFTLKSNFHDLTHLTSSTQQFRMTYLISGTGLTVILNGGAGRGHNQER